MALAFDFYELEREPEEPALTRPPLKWAGGKRWLIRHLLPKWKGNQHRRLVEPFVGGLAVALNLKPKSALLNDTNQHLISFYRWVRDGLNIYKHRVDMRNNPRAFARNRNRFNKLVDENNWDCAEAAALFFYLNRTGFNGLCRFNRRGYFNVPFGRYKTIPYRDVFEDTFPECSTLLKNKNFKLRTGDFKRIRLRPDDFIYADPPYDVEFTSYSKDGFTWDDQERLAEWLAAHKGPVVASNQATTRILDLYRGLGFTIPEEPLRAPRRISCDGNRDDAREMLATLNL